MTLAVFPSNSHTPLVQRNEQKIGNRHRRLEVCLIWRSTTGVLESLLNAHVLKQDQTFTYLFNIYDVHLLSPTICADKIAFWLASVFPGRALFNSQ